MSSIKISQLDEFFAINEDDFMLLVDSSSLTTYRTTISSLENWFSNSGSSLSSSFSSHSKTTESSSWTLNSLSSSTAHNLVWPNSSSSSFSVNSLSSSWAARSENSITSSTTTGTSSWAGFSKSSSFSNTSSIAITASYFNFTLPTNTPPTASYSDFSKSSSYSDFSKSSSYSDFSKSSSYTITSSYVNSTAGGGATPIAWAHILIPTASNYSSDTPSTVTVGNTINKPIIINSYNIGDVKWAQKTISSDSTYYNGRPASQVKLQNSGVNLLVTLLHPSSNLNYVVIGTGFQQMTEYMVASFYPYQHRTSTQFTMSLQGNFDWSGLPEISQLSFVIYS